MSELQVRRERGGDEEAIRVVHRAAFASGDGRDEPLEVGLVDTLRSDRGWLPHLSLVAVLDGEVVGHVVATRARVDGAPAIGVGPVGVTPRAQGRGVGAALMHALLGVAREHGETLAALLGDPGYYRRFGFVPAAELGVAAPDPAWGGHFQAIALAAPTPTGTFRYAAPFDGLG